MKKYGNNVFNTFKEETSIILSLERVKQHASHFNAFQTRWVSRMEYLLFEEETNLHGHVLHHFLQILDDHDIARPDLKWYDYDKLNDPDFDERRYSGYLPWETTETMTLDDRVEKRQKRRLDALRAAQQNVELEIHATTQEDEEDPLQRLSVLEDDMNHMRAEMLRLKHQFGMADPLKVVRGEKK